jgi:DNA-binding PadR family transcriptional regulator
MGELVAAGLMRRGREIPGGLVYYHVTDAGRAAVGL